MAIKHIDQRGLDGIEQIAIGAPVERGVIVRFPLVVLGTGQLHAVLLQRVFKGLHDQRRLVVGIDRLFPRAGQFGKDDLSRIGRAAFAVEIPAPAAAVLTAHHQLGALIHVRGDGVQPVVLVMQLFAAEAQLGDAAATVRAGLPVERRQRVLQLQSIPDGRAVQMRIDGVPLQLLLRPALQRFKGGGLVLRRDSERLIDCSM